MTQELFELDKNNVEQQMAFDLVKKTDKSLFITGKAGTGKTTFIKLIQKEIDKKFHFLKQAYHAYHAYHLVVLSICNKKSVSPANPHFKEFIRNAVNLCAFYTLVGQELFVQQSADGILD
jgi:ATPase subunit of ABC transporter with duplicated ATPase domains